MSDGIFPMPGGWGDSFAKRQRPSDASTLPPFTSYRVSQVDAAFDKASLELSLKSALEVPDDEEVRVLSLAPSAAYPDRKVATISVKGSAEIIKNGLKRRELFLIKSGVMIERPVIIDTRFMAFTTLNDPTDTGGHKFDVIAVTGLGGHPFGSFRVSDGEYMWLRDSLPKDLPGARVMIYGYDSQIAGSESFQGLEEIGLTLRESLRGVRKATPISNNPIPIILIGHSMGGLVIKKAICLMAEDHEEDKEMLASIYGILFFGVPNQGMAQESLVAMARGQPNETLLHNLGTGSEQLRILHGTFQKAFNFGTSVIYSFYETEKSPTAIKKAGEWVMDGPTAVLVGIASATQGRSGEKDDRHLLPIKRTHSMLVKFEREDQYYDIVLNILRSFSNAAIGIIAERLGEKNHGPQHSEIQRPISIVPRLSWPLSLMKPESPTEKKVQSQQVLDNFESASIVMSKDPQRTAIDNFQLLVHSQTLELGSRQEMQRQLLLQAEARRLQDAFFQSIVSHDFHASKVIPNPFKGTCQWLLSKEQYITWIKEESFPKVFLIVAGTGRGKSVLAKYVAREVFDDRGGSIVLSFFCKNDNAERKTAVNVIQQLLYQFISARPGLLRQLPNQVLERGIQAKGVFQPLWEIFVTLTSAQNLGPVYFIIDGLDECDEKSRTLICNSIRRDVLESSEPAMLSAEIRILITSQPNPEVRNLGEDSILLEIMPKDVRQDIYDIVHEGISKVSSKNIVSAELASSIEIILREKADGLFQWAALVLEDLNASNQSHAESRILELFQTVPPSLSGLYERALNNIVPKDRPIAHGILRLLLFASRPLTEAELTYALALTNHGESYSRHSDIIRSGNLEPTIDRTAKAVCGSFMKYSEEDSLFTISHDSARFFLANHRKLPEGQAIFDVGKGHSIMAKICLQYLLLDDVRSQSESEDEESLYSRYPFLKYAESSWDYHLMEVADFDGMEMLIFEFFDNHPNFRAWKAAWPGLITKFPDYQSVSDSVVLHLLVQCGLTNVLLRCALLTIVDEKYTGFGPQDSILLLATDVDVVDSDGQTALMTSVALHNMTAAFYFQRFKANHHLKNNIGYTLAHYSVISGNGVYIKVLRTSGVDVHLPDAYGRTPLHVAIGIDNKDAIELLLDLHPKSNSITGETALHLAVMAGNDELVRNLLASEKNVNRMTNDGDTYLKLAVESKSQKIVEMLLARHADPDLADNQGWTPLHIAALIDSESIFDSLLDAGPDINTTSHTGETPLMSACDSGSLTFVIKLLPLVSNINGQDEDGEVALHFAVRAKSAAIVEKLIECGANINIVDHNGYSALHKAASEGLESITEILLANENILVDQPEQKSSRTPLYEAVRTGHAQLVPILLSHHACPEGIIVDAVLDRRDNITALQGAASNGSFEIVKCLVAAGANLEAKWRGGFTPLHAACINNHTAVITLLLDNEANPLCKNEDGIGPQHLLALNGEEEILTRILDHGGDKMWDEGNISTPLHWACRGGSESIVRLLLKRGLDPDSCDEKGVTPLHEASMAGHAAICRLLLERDIDIDQTDKGGSTALMKALEKSQPAVAELLLSRHAKLHCTDSEGWTALHVASRHGLSQVVRLILRGFSQINCLTNKKTTPLLCAITGKHVPVARILIRLGADVDKADTQGWSPLHHAAAVGSKALITILLENTHNINRPAKYGFTPLSLALANGFDEIVQELLTSGASTHMPYYTGSSLVCFAAFCCGPEIVKRIIECGARRKSDDSSSLEFAIQRKDGQKSLQIIPILLADGADPNLKDSLGNTPLNIAAMIGHRKAVVMLLAAGGEIGLVDCYGRTAYYWIKKLYNNSLSLIPDFCPPIGPDENIRSRTTEKSIRQCIVWLKKTRGHCMYLYRTLGKCLLFQNDNKNAAIAFERRIVRNDKGHIHESRCTAPYHPYPYTDGLEARQETKIQGTMYVCFSCESVTICEACFNKLQSQESHINGCFCHKFLLVPRRGWETLSEDTVDENGQTVHEWLGGLRDTTEDEINGLQIWRTSGWTQAFAWRQVYGGMWELD